MTNEKKELLLEVLKANTVFVIYMDYNVSVKSKDDYVEVEIFNYQQISSRMGLRFVSYIIHVAFALDVLGCIYCNEDGPIIQLF